MQTPNQVLEFSRSVEAESLVHGESKKTFTATAEECEALQRRFSIERLADLSAALTITRRGSGKRMKITVRGQLHARIEQICVVSLEPFESQIKIDIDCVFDSQAMENQETFDLDLQDEDPAEPLIEGLIDFGELIAQSLSLEIAPHPKKPGSESAQVALDRANPIDDPEAISAENPFAILKNMKITPKN